MKQKYLIFSAFIIFLILGCQNDDFEFDYDSTTTISSSSLLGSFLQRSLQNETTKDNFIDASSAVKIEFPYTIQINNQSFNLIEEDDYQSVINYLENENLTFYGVDFSFPLEVSLVNFEKITLQNFNEFEALIANSTESSEINCIHFTYPIELNSFSSSDENSTTRIVNNQAQFYNFLQFLREQNGFFQFTYPLKLNINGQNTEINSVADLENTFNALANQCFEPNLYVPSTPVSQLDEFLMDESFFVFNLFEDGEDETDEVDQFRFTFNADATILVLNTENQTNSNGTWQIEEHTNQIKLVLSFEDAALEELIEDWVVEEFGNNNQISLSDDQDQLIFEKLE
ncbi:hypothetical protein [Psychroflexus salis]|uniref:Lipoprotein n=1 Tax=Psychroflexus salis TaxID=1526574 RepID=A0A916ZP63_9FLAO|nr:hypothetical protein [Psychroflexus salis]GGE07375.1 hypothetical protein GCM10010831_06090 [Psychroflexus salis]